MTIVDILIACLGFVFFVTGLRTMRRGWFRSRSHVYTGPAARLWGMVHALIGCVLFGAAVFAPDAAHTLMRFVA